MPVMMRGTHKRCVCFGCEPVARLPGWHLKPLRAWVPSPVTRSHRRREAPAASALRLQDSRQSPSWGSLPTQMSLRRGRIYLEPSLLPVPFLVPFQGCPVPSMLCLPLLCSHRHRPCRTLYWSFRVSLSHKAARGAVGTGSGQLTCRGGRKVLRPWQSSEGREGGSRGLRETEPPVREPSKHAWTLALVASLANLTAITP